MPMFDRERRRAALRDALRTLEDLNLDFRDPFITSGGAHVYVVAECVLTDIELLELNASGRLKPSNIESLRVTQRIATASSALS